MSESIELETSYIPHIRTQMASGSLVLFTGAGFSLEGINQRGKSLPSAGELTRALWEICYPNDDFENDTQLQDIYDTAQNRHARQLEELLNQKFLVNPVRCPKWYAELLLMPWLRCYTLNIDNLIEQVGTTLNLPREIREISALSDDVSKLSGNFLDVIHLNGSMNNVPNNVTFSRTQYAERIGTDPFYQQLNADLLTRPVIFIGSSLEEGPLWEHLVARGKKGDRSALELRPKSYLVLPHLNRSKISMLAKFNIIWLPMSGEEFCEKIIARIDETRSSGFSALKDRGLVSDTRNMKLRLVSDIAQLKTIESEFLLGQEPVWSDVHNGKVIERECFDELWSTSKGILANTAKHQFLIVTGTAGSGKSAALMWLALKLESEGVVTAWMDAETKFSPREFTKATEKLSGVGALLINDADIYGGAISSMIRTLLDRYPRLLIVIESRSSKVDLLINHYELADIVELEITMPNLCDSDIDKLISVLDKEHRLGALKGMSDIERINSFKRVAGRQLLVAMYEATSGQRFADRAADELSDLSNESKMVYALVSAASAYRYSLTRDELVLACGTANNETLNNINDLSRRKLINRSQSGSEFLKARHRVIANLVYQELVQSGQFTGVLRGLLMIGVAKVSKGTDRNSRPARLLRTFINHKFMKRAVDSEVARNIYGEFEDALSWDSHYWLHRGALELETGQLSLAENFLGQAMSIAPEDIFIQTEWAYLLFKKALSNPSDTNAHDYIEEATQYLQSIIIRRKDHSAHAYHILGQQSLAWASSGIHDDTNKRVFLRNLETQIEEAMKLHPKDQYLPNLFHDIERATLSLATAHGK